MANSATSEALAAAAGHVTETVEDCLQTAISSFQAAGGKEYDADRWAKDMAALWACGVKGWARALADLSAVAAALADDQSEGKATDGGGSSGGTAGGATEGGPEAGPPA